MSVTKSLSISKNALENPKNALENNQLMQSIVVIGLIFYAILMLKKNKESFYFSAKKGNF